MFKLMGKKIFIIVCIKSLLVKAYANNLTKMVFYLIYRFILLVDDIVDKIIQVYKKL